MSARAHGRETVFINREKLYAHLTDVEPAEDVVDEILNRALKLKGLSFEDAAVLLNAAHPVHIEKILRAAGIVKNAIYGKRLVFFAPIYTGNKCVNDCVYCAFRKSNKTLRRVVLAPDQIEEETKILLRQGHKRALLICGESEENATDYMVEAIKRTYAAREGAHSIRRINVELAPMDVEDFRKIKAQHIGTYICFQETYDETFYKKYHPGNAKKSDYEYRLTVMDRAMEGGIDDVGIGALFGLADYRFEVLALLEHAAHLERAFGCGPHTVSVPRIEPAEGAPFSLRAPYAVSDDNFKKLVAIIRIALPYTGIILSTRENDAMRNELFRYGVSQISAGSRTNPGAYTEGERANGSQFSLGDHRSLDEVALEVTRRGYIPSFCTGCYRKGRVGKDFMDLAKPGLIHDYCMPNGIFTFKEYLNDFASAETKREGEALIARLVEEEKNEALKTRMKKTLSLIDEGVRDAYF